MNTIRKQLRSLKHITPNAQKKADFRHVLEQRVRADMHTYSMRTTSHVSWTAFFRPLFHAPSFALAIVIVILGSSGGIAFASQTALPGTTLYGVKLKTEQARITFTRDDKKKAELHITFASRRMHEIEELINNEIGDNTIVTETVAHYEHELSEGESLLEKNPEATHTVAALLAATESHKDTIKILREKIAARSHGKIHDDLEEAYEHAESHSDTALLAALSVTATSSSAETFSPAVIETSRKKIRALEKDIQERKRAAENTGQKQTENDTETTEVKTKLENAETIIKNAKTRLENEEYRESIERSIKARALMKEASSLEKERDRREHREEKERSEERSDDDSDRDRD